LPGVEHSARFDQDTAEIEFWFETTTDPQNPAETRDDPQ
jgi:hypothetical protein